uniref:(northern house mosquito) hypothetical protein n=1 Tax=Culex pipiens TaxID=7175 RepID=A0A8D8JF11_CULPI
MARDDLPQMPIPARETRVRHDGHLRRQFLVLSPLPRPQQQARSLQPQTRPPSHAGRSLRRWERARRPAHVLRALHEPLSAQQAPHRVLRAVQTPPRPRHGHGTLVSAQRQWQVHSCSRGRSGGREEEQSR